MLWMTRAEIQNGLEVRAETCARSSDYSHGSQYNVLEHNTKMAPTIRCLSVLLILKTLFEATNGGYLQSLMFGRQCHGSAFRVLPSLSLHACYEACRHRRRCVSFNYHRLGSRCQLNEGDETTTQLVWTSGYVYSKKASWQEVRVKGERVFSG